MEKAGGKNVRYIPYSGELESGIIEASDNWRRDNMAKKVFEIEVEEVRGDCSAGYKAGDKFIANGLDTPAQPMCGGAYIALFPMQNALHSGARFSFEENPQSKTKLSCPDNGYVNFKITLLKNEKGK